MARRTRRTNPGRVELYRDAGAVARTVMKELWRPMLLVAAMLVLMNVWSGFSWLSGVVTGAFVVLFAAMVAVAVFFLSGLSYRLFGTWAESFTTEALESATAEVQLVKSLRWEMHDLDHVAIARHGIYVIETKWHLRRNDNQLGYEARLIAERSRSLRSYLTLSKHRVDGVPGEAFQPLLVVWGEGGHDLAPITFHHGLGDVVVMGGAYLADWLGQRGRGTLPIDVVRAVKTCLEDLAVEREAAHAPKSRVLRRLAQVR